jgi:hypothetical protein
VVGWRDGRRRQTRGADRAERACRSAFRSPTVCRARRADTAPNRGGPAIGRSLYCAKVGGSREARACRPYPCHMCTRRAYGGRPSGVCAGSVLSPRRLMPPGASTACRTTAWWASGRNRPSAPAVRPPGGHLAGTGHQHLLYDRLVGIWQEQPRPARRSATLLRDPRPRSRAGQAGQAPPRRPGRRHAQPHRAAEHASRTCLLECLDGRVSGGPSPKPSERRPCCAPHASK